MTASLLLRNVRPNAGAAVDILVENGRIVRMAKGIAAPAGVAVEDGRGEIVIDERCRTSVPGIFAAGDCTTQAYKQIITSMGSGATASLAAFDHLIRSQA